MKIIYLIESLKAGGKERRFSELVRRLQHKPHIELEIVVMNEEIHYPVAEATNIKIHYLIRKTKKDFSVFKKFYSICKKSRPDIVHCWDDMTAIIAVPACKLLQIKLVNGMVNNTPTKRNILNKIYLRAKISFLFSDVIIGNSKAGILAFNAPLKKSLLIYNGFNFDRKNQISSKNEIRKQLNITTKYVIGMVATFSPQKDYKTFYNAAEIVLSRRKDITFLAIGANTDSAESQNMVNDPFKVEHFRFLGTQSNIESLINIIDVGILATYTEGISNAIMEFMAMGKPVIATDGGGTNEIIKDQETGYLISTYDSQDLADKMELMIGDEDKRIKMGNAGMKRIEDVFSIDVMVKEFIAAYQNLLA